MFCLRSKVLRSLSVFIVHVFKAGDDIYVSAAHIHSGELHAVVADAVLEHTAERYGIDKFFFRIRYDLFGGYGLEETLPVLFINKL